MLLTVPAAAVPCTSQSTSRGCAWRCSRPDAVHRRCDLLPGFTVHCLGRRESAVANYRALSVLVALQYGCKYSSSCTRPARIRENRSGKFTASEGWRAATGYLQVSWVMGDFVAGRSEAAIQTGGDRPNRIKSRLSDCIAIAPALTGPNITYIYLYVTSRKSEVAGAREGGKMK